MYSSDCDACIRRYVCGSVSELREIGDVDKMDRLS
jgi:hypothetical protein